MKILGKGEYEYMTFKLYLFFNSSFLIVFFPLLVIPQALFYLHPPSSMNVILKIGKCLMFLLCRNIPSYQVVRFLKISTLPRQPKQGSKQRSCHQNFTPVTTTIVRLWPRVVVSKTGTGEQIENIFKLLFKFLALKKILNK